MNFFNMQQIIYIDGGEESQIINKKSLHVNNVVKREMLYIFLQLLLYGDKKDDKPLFVLLFLPYLKDDIIDLIHRICVKTPSIIIEIYDLTYDWNVSTIMTNYKIDMDTLMYVYGHGTLSGEPNIFNEILRADDIKLLMASNSVDTKMIYMTPTCYGSKSTLTRYKRINKNFFYLPFDKTGKRCNSTNAINKWIKPIFQRLCFSDSLVDLLNEVYNHPMFNSGMTIRPLFEMNSDNNDDDGDGDDDGRGKNRKRKNRTRGKI